MRLYIWTGQMWTSIKEFSPYAAQSLASRATCRFICSATVGRLKEYAEKRDRVVRTPPSQAFFLSERGTRITEWMARYTFAKISQQLGFRRKAKGHGRGPRLHDMRHRFAAHALVRWYRQGLDVERELPKLATYLGVFSSARDTYRKRSRCWIWRSTISNNYGRKPSITFL